MSDQRPDAHRPPYAAAAELLASDHSPIDLAEAHGLLTGLLSGRPDATVAVWSNTVLDGRPPRASAALLDALHELTRQQLASEEFAFALFLPGSEAPLSERTEAASSWCLGYLSGLGLADIDQEQIRGDAEEFLRDVVQIGRLAHDKIEENEESERDFMELSEYLRVGVYMVRDALLDDTGQAVKGKPS